MGKAAEEGPLGENSSDSIGEGVDRLPGESPCHGSEHVLMGRSGGAAGAGLDEHPASLRASREIRGNAAGPKPARHSRRVIPKSCQVTLGRRESRWSGNDGKVMERPGERSPVDDPHPDFLRDLSVHSAPGRGQLKPLARENRRIPLDGAAKLLHFHLQFRRVADLGDRTAQLPGASCRTNEQGKSQLVRQSSIQLDAPRSRCRNLNPGRLHGLKNLVQFKKRRPLVGAVPDEREGLDKLPVIFNLARPREKESFVLRLGVGKLPGSEFIEPAQAKIAVPGGYAISCVIEEVHGGLIQED